MSSSDDNAPKRFIYNQHDMEHFKNSTARKELSSFVCAMGRGLTSTNSNNTIINGGYNSNSPLQHLTPALASLHGSLTCISQTWMEQIPPDLKVKARFGNPAFRTWHAQLVDRSYGIVRSLMDCHVKYSSGGVDNDSNNNNNMEDEAKQQILKDCSDQGYRAATSEGTKLWSKDDTTDDSSLSKQEEIITELRAYLHDGFGHPIRIDYGTGHESSFIVFLLSLCKIGCFSWAGNGNSANSNNKDDNKDTNPNQSSEAISLGSLSIFHAYLSVTRGLQRDYMLEPAGSHGVWGLDDYHCVPFYLGACQMVAREQWQKQQSMKKKNCDSKDQTVLEHNPNDNDKEDETTKRMPDNPYLPEATSTSATDPSSSSSTTSTVDTHNDNSEHWGPSVIHDKQIMENHRSTYLYLSCIHFIQQIKPGVPFFESSPMLNDISHLGNWTKVSSGLLRLYEGEVLDKLPVVQHFVFGKIFNADWEPSRQTPLEAPTKTFVNGPMGEECIAPWASNTSSNMPPPTRAPWAK